jgi:hypothetical protein
MCGREIKCLYAVAWKTGRKDTTWRLGRKSEVLKYSFEKQNGRMKRRLLDLTGSGQGLVTA